MKWTHILPAGLVFVSTAGSPALSGDLETSTRSDMAAEAQPLGWTLALDEIDTTTLRLDEPLFKEASSKQGDLILAHSGDGATHPAVKSSQPGGSNSNLANQATDPTSALIQLQLQNVFKPNTRGAEGYSHSFIVQPVIPIHLGDDFYFEDLLTRTTIPVVRTADPKGPVGHKTGLGDTTLLLNPVHKWKAGDNLGFTWGPIAALQLPTGTTNQTGSGKFSLGPGGVLIGSVETVFTDGDSLQFGAYGYNIWSAAGHSDRADVNEFYLGPIFTYHFAELFGQQGWYARWTDELQSYDWNAESGGVASIPVGAALGKVFSIGEQNVNVFLAGDYYAAHRTGDPVWDIKLNVTLLFPE